jgi:S1-C subfamily serine protease
LTNRLTNVALTVGFATLLLALLPARHAGAEPQPLVTLLDLHPADMGLAQGGKPVVIAMPRIIRRGSAAGPDQSQITVPSVVTPNQPEIEDQANAIGRAGTGFFISGDGTLLTAAHVVKECSRMQVISKYVPRTWVSLVASDQANDIAILKSVDFRPSWVVRLATSAPASGRLFVLGFPASAGLTVAAETWGVVENQKFPTSIGPLANPRELLWLSAPDVTHGFSGGPIYDPKLGAVVGLVKGEVDGGYLRLVRDMPTTGMAIGPGTNHIAELLRRELPYSAISLASAPGEGGQDSVRRATVHVLCWH